MAQPNNALKLPAAPKVGRLPNVAAVRPQLNAVRYAAGSL